MTAQELLRKALGHPTEPVPASLEVIREELRRLLPEKKPRT
ncbi:MAG TPA: hypothetical protein VE596_18230 [Gaiellaceae bacterium]|jgi:hypothetical protein|nr:hypothetical protein [Gaiellaceae bacterium]